jgi:hypothetical protein
MLHLVAAMVEDILLELLALVALVVVEVVGRPLLHLVLAEGAGMAWYT